MDMQCMRRAYYRRPIGADRKASQEKDRERNRRIALSVIAAAVAGGIATAWVPPIPRHGDNIEILEILRFGLRWLLAVAVPAIPAALSVPVADHVLGGPWPRLQKLWVRYFGFDSTRTRSPWDSGWQFCVFAVATILILWPLIIVMFVVVFGFVVGH
jgi:hypothetical protein